MCVIIMSEEIDIDSKSVKELRVRLSVQMSEWLEEIMKHEGLVSLAETTRFLIREQYKEMKKELLEE